MPHSRCLIKVIVTLLFLITAPALLAGETRAYAFPQGSGGSNAAAHLDKPYLILVSLDGFRWDYPDLYDLPALQQIIGRGFRAERLLPVFPTLTFPNHYSIATGLYPRHHGLVGNRFYAPEMDTWYELSKRATVQDGRFYAGEPIWVTAESQGMVTAAFFFVGTEADIMGIRPTHWRNFSKAISGEERVDQALSWLAEPAVHRPHLLTLYFEDTDDNSHWSGVGSEPALESMQRVDSYLRRLLEGIQALPFGHQVNVLVVSDHGQGSYIPNQSPLVLDEHIDLEGIRVVGQGSYAFLYLAEADETRLGHIKSTLNGAWAHGHALSPAEAPESWNLGTSDRWPDLILAPEPGHAVVSTRSRFDKLNPGAHGWSPEDPAMHGILLGMGPNLRQGARTGPIRNVDIYPLLAEILELQSPAMLDSDPNALREVLLAR